MEIFNVRIFNKNRIRLWLTDLFLRIVRPGLTMEAYVKHQTECDKVILLHTITLNRNRLAIYADGQQIIESKIYL